MSVKIVLDSMNMSVHSFLGIWFLFGVLPDGSSFFRIGWPTSSLKTVHSWANFHRTNEMFAMTHGMTVAEMDEMEFKLRADIERIVLMEEDEQICSTLAESTLAELHDVIEYLRIAKAVRLHNEAVVAAA